MTPVRWGFLGAGMIAGVLAKAVHDADGAVLQAAGARDPERARALGAADVYGSYDEVLASPDVDAVYIALSNDAHAPWTAAALRAGKAVLCEKPLALTTTEVDMVSAAVAETGGLAVEASWYRWHPRVRQAQATLLDVGPVRHVAAGFTFAGRLTGNYRLEAGRGGGALYDVGCYAVSACLWAVGRGLPDEVVARSELSAGGVDLDTRAILTWEPADGHPGAEAEVHASISVDHGQWLVVRGERGEVELRDSPYTAVGGQDTELWVSDGTGTRRDPVAAADAYRLMVEQVSSVLRGGPGWVLPLAESRQTAAVLDAARASAAAGGEPVRPS
jgi:D-xylose 1-dehydrogenase (NADP+, D-xylono-1,5-lactone-forming)